MTSLTIAMALQQAHGQLQQVSETPLLDAEILLAEVLKVSRTYLFAFAERELTVAEINQFERFVMERRQHVPLAYITGHKEFWSLDLRVTPDTLIPRAETELLVEQVLQQVSGENKTIADCGTGSGAIALALAYERPHWEIHATDCSLPALQVARDNALRHGLFQVIFHQGNWLDALPRDKKFDVIVSNPPYIAEQDPLLQCASLSYEPRTALAAKENGLKDLRHIIKEARSYLKPGGLLLLEHGFEQAGEIRRIFANMGYSHINTYSDLAGLDRVTGGSF